MADFDSVLEQARGLSIGDQARLVHALWDSVPDDMELSLHPDWGPELERRVEDLKTKKESTVPWDQILKDSLARIGHDHRG